MRQSKFTVRDKAGFAPVADPALSFFNGAGEGAADLKDTENDIKV